MGGGGVLLNLFISSTIPSVEKNKYTVYISVRVVHSEEDLGYHSNRSSWYLWSVIIIVIVMVIIVVSVEWSLLWCVLMVAVVIINYRYNWCCWLLRVDTNNVGAALVVLWSPWQRRLLATTRSRNKSNSNRNSGFGCVCVCMRVCVCVFVCVVGGVYVRVCVWSHCLVIAAGKLCVIIPGGKSNRKTKCLSEEKLCVWPQYLEVTGKLSACQQENCLCDNNIWR